MRSMKFIGYFRRVKKKRIGYLVPSRLLERRLQYFGCKGEGEDRTS